MLCFLYYVVSRFLQTTDQNKQSKTISDFLILSLSQQKYLIPAPQKSLEEISHMHFISSRFFYFLILSQLFLIRQRHSSASSYIQTYSACGLLTCAVSSFTPADFSACSFTRFRPSRVRHTNAITAKTAPIPNTTFIS